MPPRHSLFRYEGTGYREDREVVQRHEQTLVGNLRSQIPRVDGALLYNVAHYSYLEVELLLVVLTSRYDRTSSHCT